jgi:hypothetical protein
MMKSLVLLAATVPLLPTGQWIPVAEGVEYRWTRPYGNSCEIEYHATKPRYDTSFTAYATIKNSADERQQSVRIQGSQTGIQHISECKAIQQVRISNLKRVKSAGPGEQPVDSSEDPSAKSTGAGRDRRSSSPGAPK